MTTARNIAVLNVQNQFINTFLSMPGKNFKTGLLFMASSSLLLL
jgi:hypothetical protein